MPMTLGFSLSSQKPKLRGRLQPTYLDSQHFLVSLWGLEAQACLGARGFLFLPSLQDFPENLLPLDLPVGKNQGH